MQPRGGFAVHPIVLIPSRMAATRLPGKPMADIHGVPMIVHVWRRAVEADIGPVAVATDTDEIAAVIRAAGGIAIMTRADHPTGSDRILEALLSFDAAGRHDVIVNVQGDLPTLKPDLPRAAAALLDDPAVDIGTLACVIEREEEKTAPHIVKAVATPVSPDGRRLRALYFTRATAPTGDGPLLHHIGLYAYRRSALERFCCLAPATLEKRERLEQLRALENGMRIDVALVDTVPLGVDTEEELERARGLLA
jgi:3-deoxy-manno-octulosonate cytidylyltransferase (CMP-KDO synthetase)